ncbi:MAG TPA: hypothetical protein VFU89_04695 [Rhabdochlamydiaceae bacterium]|nr:hypothetical protein [Rhabdochlamydiaceae bacterium]
MAFSGLVYQSSGIIGRLVLGGARRLRAKLGARVTASKTSSVVNTVLVSVIAYQAWYILAWQFSREKKKILDSVNHQYTVGQTSNGQSILKCLLTLLKKNTAWMEGNN